MHIVALMSLLRFVGVRGEDLSFEKLDTGPSLCRGRSGLVGSDSLSKGSDVENVGSSWAEADNLMSCWFFSLYFISPSFVPLLITGTRCSYIPYIWSNLISSEKGKRKSTDKETS
jgi:hypothetical protein